MSQYDPKKIEELQIILLRNPRSPVFAALAEAYRKMGLLEEALEVTTKGIKHNPDYVSGLVAHSKILYELKDYRQALKFLGKANLLRPENILALRLLGHCHLKMRQYKKSLGAFKKLLIIKPTDKAAIQFVKKWDFLDNLPLNSNSEAIELEHYDSWVKELPSTEQVTHLIDSFMNNGDWQSALEIANTALSHWPTSEDIKQRQKLLLETPNTHTKEVTAPQNPALHFLQIKKKFYQQWLQRIDHTKSVDPS